MWFRSSWEGQELCFPKHTAYKLYVGLSGPGDNDQSYPDMTFNDTESHGEQVVPILS